MIVLDVETTGIDPKKCSLLSIGAVDFKRPFRQFYGECRAWEGAEISDIALEINGFTREEVHSHTKRTPSELLWKFHKWARRCEEYTIIGENPKFDYDFVAEEAKRSGMENIFGRRTLDMHTVSYINMLQNGASIPMKNKCSALNADTTYKYLGMPEEPTPHNALNGAIWEAEAMHRLLYNKPLFDRFKDHS